MSETIFGKVFLGGSKRIGRLPDKVVRLRFLCMGRAFYRHKAEPYGSQTSWKADLYISFHNR